MAHSFAHPKHPKRFSCASIASFFLWFFTAAGATHWVLKAWPYEKQPLDTPASWLDDGNRANSAQTQVETLIKVFAHQVDLNATTRGDLSSSENGHSFELRGVAQAGHEAKALITRNNSAVKVYGLHDEVFPGIQLTGVEKDRVTLTPTQAPGSPFEVLLPSRSTPQTNP